MKEKITKDNINQYYEKINNIIDSYFEWNISPVQLKRYLRKGSKGLMKFINRNGLDNINRIEKIITDVIEDRNGMVEDNVLTFENYEFKDDIDNEVIDSDIIWDNIKESDISYEKIIADFYKTSLGHVEKLNIKKHLYNVSNIEINNDVIVFSKEDMEIIKTNLKKFILQFLKTQSVKLSSLNVNIEIKDLLSGDKFEYNVDDKVNDVISEILSNEDFDFVDKFKGYFIYQK